MRYAYLIYDNGREMDLDGGSYASEADALAAGLASLDDCVPKSSPMRRFYRVSVTTTESEVRS